MYAARPWRSTRRLQNLIGQVPRWFKIENKKATGQASLVSIYDEIGFFGVSAGEFLAELSGVDGDLDVHINSPGGDVFDAIAIYNTLKNRAGSVAITIDGLAASAASFIAQAASPGMLTMAPHSTMMIHDGFASGIGNASDMRELANQLDAASDNIAGIYASRTGKAASYWRAKMQAETWYTDAEAVADGLADQVSGGSDPHNSWDFSVFKNKGAASPDTGDDGPDGDDGGWVQRGDGEWVFDPDEDGDDDYQAETDTDHGWWDEDGNQLKPIPASPDGSKPAKPMPKKAKDKKAKSGQRINNDGVDNSPWDASKAWHNGTQADDPAAFYRAICAGEKTSGDPDTQDHWALPYRYTPDSAPNLAGVRNALSRLGQTHDLKDPDGTRSKLEGLMKKINPDYEPGDHLNTTLLAAALGTALKGVR